MVCELVQEAAGLGGGDDGVADRDGTHTGEQFFRACVLEEEPAGAGAEGGVGVLVQVEGGQDENAGAATGGDDVTSGLDAVHARHAYVHENDVRPQFGGLADGFGPVGGLSHHFELGHGLEQHAKAEALQIMVVDDEHRGHAAPPRGVRSRVASTVHPPPGAGPALRLPP